MATTQHMDAVETLRQLKDSPDGNLGVAESSSSSSISFNEFLQKICSYPLVWFEIGLKGIKLIARTLLTSSVGE